MTSSTTNRALWRGARNSLPFIFVAGPFGLLFGVVASEAGLHVLESFSFSIAVFAGAAQFTALQLMQDQAPTLVVLASALAVNLRMAMYSASLTPHLGHLPLWKRGVVAYFLVDQAYALAIVKYEREPEMTNGERFAYFVGTVTPICPLWYGFTVIGAMVGAQISLETGLDFAMPIAFLALIGPALRTGAHGAAALVASVSALLFAFLPYNLGLLVAALLGMMAGAEIERRSEAA